MELSGIENVTVDGSAVDVTVSGNIIAVSGTDSASISVVSLSGAVMAAAEGTVLDISALESGAYVAVVKTASVTRSLKFIKR